MTAGIAKLGEGENASVGDLSASADLLRPTGDGDELPAFERRC